jgi:hypothetical protein
MRTSKFKEFKGRVQEL